MKVRNSLTSFKIVCVASLLVGAPNLSAAQEWRSPELEQMQLFLNLMQDFFGIIDSMYQVSSNPEEAAIFQMHKIQEVYEEQGNKARAITVFEEVLEETSNPTIRNATYLMLGDALKETGRSDEAIEALRAGLRENIRNAGEGR